jgi:hypothetical protein
LEQGALGFPRSGESECRVPDPRDRYQVFEGGRIYWRAATNEASVLNNPTNLGDGGTCGSLNIPGLPDLKNIRRQIERGGPTPPQTPAAPAQRARFRVSLTGFTCRHETVDNLVGADGWGDEVYFDTNVWTVNGTHDVISHTNRRSIVMGDTRLSNPGRVRAGTASPQGGIRTGDNAPNATPWSLAAGAKLEDDRLPMLLWEGELVQGATGPLNAVIIMPTIWEWDGFDQLARRWSPLLNSTFHSPNIDLTASQSPVIDLDIRFGGDSLWRGHPERSSYSDAPIYLDGTGADRPIGLRTSNSTPRRYVFSPQALLLNYQLAERAISRAYTSNGLGVVQISYAESADDGGTRGNYDLFFLIERMP